jgi:glycosyltransferase involved in cell wall biosynthesis
MSIEKVITLSILMPCLNEARTLGTCISKAQAYLARQNFLGEIIVADNGSIDGSMEIAKSLGARVVAVPERGYGKALQMGIKAAHGKFVIMGDADDSYDFGSLEAFIKAQAGVRSGRGAGLKRHQSGATSVAPLLWQPADNDRTASLQKPRQRFLLWSARISPRCNIATGAFVSRHGIRPRDDRQIDNYLLTDHRGSNNTAS